MGESGAVRVGMRVRDLDGVNLGKVTRCDEWGFEIEKGFFSPREAVARYDEVVRIDGGTIVLARSERALFELAAGELPSIWRSPAAAPLDGHPGGATPSEARALEDARAAASPPVSPRTAAPAPARSPVLTREDEREFVESRGQDQTPSAAHPHG